MAFRVPTMLLDCNIWHPPNGPPGLPDLTVKCQLRYPGTQSTGQDPSAGWVFLWEALFPPRTAVNDSYTTPGSDLVEIPAGTGRLYTVMMVDDVARGFPNEYRIAYIMKQAPWPTPIP